MKVIENLLKYRWIYHQIFGDLLDDLVYNEDIRKYKEFIKAFWYDDIDDLIIDEVDKWNFTKISKIIFRFYENKENEKEK